MDFDDLKMAEDVIQVNKTLQIVSLKLFWISQLKSANPRAGSAQTLFILSHRVA